MATLGAAGSGSSLALGLASAILCLVDGWLVG